MAKDRTMPCESYISKGVCTKNREAEHNGYCQKCNKYVPRAKPIKDNTKKTKLNKIRKQEMKNERY